MFIKDPSAVLDYTVDWTDWLPPGDTITAATWSSNGVTVADSPAPSNTGSTATAWLSGGNTGNTYTVTCTITTTGGRTDSRHLFIEVNPK
jgi:hypothetical protein